MKTPDVRWIQRLNSFRKALAQLRAAAGLAEVRKLTNLERQGLIQAFEFTHELAWNVMKDFLAERGFATAIFGSKDATRAAFAAELIGDGEAWMEMIASRNLTTHTYNEDTASEIENSVLTKYLHQFEQFHERMSGLEQEDA